MTFWYPEDFLFSLPKVKVNFPLLSPQAPNSSLVNFLKELARVRYIYSAAFLEEHPKHTLILLLLFYLYTRTSNDSQLC